MINKMQIKVSSVDFSVDTWLNSRKMFLRKVGPFVVNYKQFSIRTLNSIRRELQSADLSYNYFAFARFQMRTSILLREFFYTFIEYKAKWATTQRFGLEFETDCISSECANIPNMMKSLDKYKSLKAEYLKDKEQKIQFESVRDNMPLGYQVDWEIMIPIKQFIICLSALYRIIGQCDMWKEIYTTCYKNKILRPWLDLIPKYLYLPEIEKYFTPISDKSDKVTEVGYSLYSQLIRHEGIATSGYFDFIGKVVKGISEPTRNNSFKIIVNADAERFAQVIRIRTDWFSMTDNWNSMNSWGRIIGLVINDKSKLSEVKKYFSCFDSNGCFLSNSFGVHGLDDNLRIAKGYKTNLPNPFILQSRKIVEQRIAKSGMNPLYRMYLALFDEGYVQDNPNNELRIKWEKISESTST